MTSCVPAIYYKEPATPIVGHNVILADTILFPEGGGQPSDQGHINGLPVLHVRRHFADAIHFVETDDALAVGSTVELEVDWQLRHDHMQQHSGQHLITAILEQSFGMDTVSWYLGAETSYVQLNVSAITPEQLHDAEQQINAHIAEGCEVTVQTIENASDSSGEQQLSEQVTRATRGLPKDHVGAVRVVTFAGIESNMCCGTHVRNLSQLQVIKLLHTENGSGGGKDKSKKKEKDGKGSGKVDGAKTKTLLLHFIVGGRVLRYVQRTYERERQLNVVLGCEPNAHMQMVHKWSEKMRVGQRTVKRVQREMAALEATLVDACALRPENNYEACGYYFVHRKDGNDMGYLMALLAAVQSRDVLLFGTTGEEIGGGTAASTTSGGMILHGLPVDVEYLAPKLCALLDGKGSGKDERFQAKIKNLKNIKECEALVVGKMKEKKNCLLALMAKSREQEQSEPTIKAEPIYENIPPLNLR